MGPEYVALTTSVYRRAVDEAWDQMTAGNPAGEKAGDTAGKGQSEGWLSEEDRRDLTQVFARGQDRDHDGLTPGFLAGAYIRPLFGST